MEIVCWVAGACSSVILICAISYTIAKLRAMFPGHEFHEQGRIKCIAIIFCLSITTKSLFEWCMYYLYKDNNQDHQHHDKVMLMLVLQEIFMPVLWDVLPICTIFYLH